MARARFEECLCGFVRKGLPLLENSKPQKRHFPPSRHKRLEPLLHQIAKFVAEKPGRMPAIGESGFQRLQRCLDSGWIVSRNHPLRLLIEKARPLCGNEKAVVDQDEGQGSCNPSSSQRRLGPKWALQQFGRSTWIPAFAGKTDTVG